MDKINNTSKNEVQELLKELVVSPISEDLNNQLENLSASISILEDLRNRIYAVNGIIQRTENDINNNIDNQFSTISSNICSLEISAKKIKQQTEQISGLVSNTDSIHAEIQNAISKACEYITPFRQVVDEWRKLSFDLPKSITQTQESLSQKVLDNQETVTQKIHEHLTINKEDILKDFEKVNLLNLKVDELSKTLINVQGNISAIESDISQNIQENYQEIDRKILAVNDSLNSIARSIESTASNTSIDNQRHYQSTKNMLAFIIILSVVNILGIAGFFIIHFLHL